MAAAKKIIYAPIGENYGGITIAEGPTTKYRQCLEELDFAISAGDNEFSPAVRLILREALELYHNPRNHTVESYLALVKTIKTTYYSLLDMPTSHPIATRMRHRLRRQYTGDFWDFLQETRSRKNRKTYNIVVSDGNINKHGYFIAKRVFDILVASLLLVLLAPVFLMTILLVRLDSSGPIFFVQKRMGAKRIRRAEMTVWQPVEFDFYKFRSMYHNADESIHKEYIEGWVHGRVNVENTVENRLRMQDDPRVTRIGHFLRSTNLDELPQLFNVIKGDMSLVGPRPVPIYEIESYRQDHYERLASVPGVISLSQVNGQGRTTLERQVQMDVEYIHQQSLSRDISILISIPLEVIRREVIR